MGLFSKFSKNKKYPKSNAQSVSPPSQEQLLLPKPATDQWAASKAPFPLPPARSGFSKQEMKAMASSNRNRPPTAPGTLNASNVHLFRGRNSKKSKKIPKPKNTTFRALEHEDGMVTHMWYQKNAKAYLMRMVNPYLKYPYTTAASADDRKAWIELNGEYSERPT